MIRINWSDLNIIKEWSKENRNEYEVFDTKTIKKTDKSKKTRYVLINYSNKPVKDNWWVLFSSFKKGFNCRHDRKEMQNYNTVTYQIKLSKNKPNIRLVGEFTGIKDKHVFYCKVHNKEFKTTADTCLHRKYGCPECARLKSGLNRRKPHEDFVEELNNKFNEEFEVIGKYITQDIKIKFKHKKCGNTFFATPSKMLQGRYCDYCRQSFGERIINNYLRENNIKFSQEHRFYGCKDKRNLPFDFYLPDLNTCIEFDGKQHYFPIRGFGGLKGYVGIKRRDLIKNKYCQDNSIKLIRIPYWNLRKIYRILKDKEIV